MRAWVVGIGLIVACGGGGKATDSGGPVSGSPTGTGTGATTGTSTGAGTGTGAATGTGSGTGSLTGTAEGLIDFPPPVGITELDAVTFHGTGVSPLGGMSVDGSAATSSDGFATWEASVPTVWGSHTYDLGATLLGGASAGGLDSVELERVGWLPVELDNLTVDAAGQRAWFVDGWSVVEVDLVGGGTREVTGFYVGSGPMFGWFPDTVSWDPGGGRLLVIEDDDLFGVDPATGARSLLASASTTIGPWPTFAAAAEVDAANDRLVVVTGGGQAEWVVAFDLATYAVSALSGSANPGPIPSAVADIAMLPAGDGLLVVDTFGTRVLQVDLTTGARTTIASPTSGSGVTLYNPSVVATDGTTAWVGTANDIVAVDLSTLDRTFVLDPRQPAFLSYTYMQAMSWDGSRLLVADAFRDAVVAWDPVTGASSLYGGYHNGTGVELTQPTAVDWWAGGDQLVVMDLGELIGVEPLTADRTELSGLAVGTGVPSIATGVSVTGDVAWAWDVYTLYRYDLLTGDRELISSAGRGSGPSFGLITGVAASDAGGTELFAGSTFGWILSVDPGTGDRTTVADASVGAGPSIDGLTDLLWDGSRLLVLKSDRLLVVDPATGDRTELSGPSTGAGPALLGGQKMRWVDGRILVGAGTSVYWIDPVSGDRTQVGGVGSRGPVLALQGWAGAPDGRLWAVSYMVGGVMAVSPLTGDRVVFSR